MHAVQNRVDAPGQLAYEKERSHHMLSAIRAMGNHLLIILFYLAHSKTVPWHTLFSLPTIRLGALSNLSSATPTSKGEKKSKVEQKVNEKRKEKSANGSRARPLPSRARYQAPRGREGLSEGIWSMMRGGDLLSSYSFCCFVQYFLLFSCPLFTLSLFPLSSLSLSLSLLSLS